MAEFVQTMKDWRRMCNFMEEKYGNDSCDKCPLEGCAAIYEDDGEMDYPDIEKKVSAWAAEHPEPVYPTWADYISTLVVKDICTGKISGPETVLTYAMKTHIPVDIAEKLEVPPKPIDYCKEAYRSEDGTMRIRKTPIYPIEPKEGV